MPELSTLRERVERASRYFKTRDGIVLTTFNLNGGFFEENALPAVLGVEAETTPCRRAEVHEGLGVTPCTVFYDPASLPKLSGKYRYVARPVPITDHFFHPKLVVIAGNSEDGTTWVYLAVSSANLTLSGWGRNAESFGETWIHTRSQQTWQVLDSLLAWLGSHSPLGEKQGDHDAILRIRKALKGMPLRKRFRSDDREPWSGKLHADLYASVVHTDGLAAFLKGDRGHRPSELWANSPYWSEVTEQVAAFNAHTKTVLIPALRTDCEVLGLSREQADKLDEWTEVRRNKDDTGSRFWHMKAYRIKHRKKIRTAVGSCNFTRAGLSGSEGNVEAMLVFGIDHCWLPKGTEIATEDKLAVETEAEEGTPEPVPVPIVVAWDWRCQTWRWWLEARPRQTDFQLQIPGMESFRIQSGTGSKPGNPPAGGSTFRVSYRVNGTEAEWQGQIVEINLDLSSRTYGRPLTAIDILESWRCGALPAGRGDDRDGDLGEGDGESGGETPAAFDLVNLFDFYRAISAMRAKLRVEKDRNSHRGYLVGRPDSVMALAHLADQDKEVPIVRFLILRELYRIVETWKCVLDEDLVAQVKDMATRSRDCILSRLVKDLGGDKNRASRMLNWFEDELDELDCRLVA